MSIKTVKTETAKRYGFYQGFSGQNGKRNQNGICQNGNGLELIFEDVAQTL